MDTAKHSNAKRGLDKVLGAIKASDLSRDVISDVSKVIDANQFRLNDMFDSLSFKAPSAYEEWCDDITRQAMGLITPTLQKAQVPIESGQRLYREIYKAVLSI